MPDHPIVDEPFELSALLAAVEASPPVDVVDVIGAEISRRFGALRVRLLIANFSGDALIKMTHTTARADTHDGHNERTESLPLQGSVYEQVLLGQDLDVREAADRWDVLVPVTERGDAIGVLELTLTYEPAPAVLNHLRAVAHMLAYVLVASRRHTDLFEWAQRDQQFSLAAEIQRRLLPTAYTIEGGPFTVAGWLEPAHDAGGDTFDYSMDREFLYLSVTDAMGHGIEAALLATTAVGSLRNSRRALTTPAAQARVANEALLASSRDDQFVTGLLMRLRLADGAVEVVNAGHPRPFLLRDGEARVLDLPVMPALGITEFDYAVERFHLEPGDRVLVVTDGVLERNAFRVDVEEVLIRHADRHPREVVRELAAELLRETGQKLLDDATVLCLDWYGPGALRTARGGASPERATGSPL